MGIVWASSTDSFKPYRNDETGAALRDQRKLETCKEVDLHTMHLSSRHMEIHNTAPSESKISNVDSSLNWSSYWESLHLKWSNPSIKFRGRVTSEEKVPGRRVDREEIQSL